MHPITPLEVVLRRDRIIVSAGLAAVVVLAWAYMFHLAGNMPGTSIGAMPGMEMAMPQMHSWAAGDFILAFVMWDVMMIAMMVPAAAPMILVFAALSRQRRSRHPAFVSSGVFVLGYLAIWSGFAAAATLSQWGLHSTALLSPMLVGSSTVLGGSLLVAAGVYQWSPLKYLCLTRCRSPLQYLLAEWREGKHGILVMGLRHGAFCLGCCWVLMTLLFVLGVMNLLWVAALASFVLLEKVAPAGHWIGRIAGVLMIAWGTWMTAGGAG